MEESKGIAPRIMFFMRLLFALTVIIQLKFSSAAENGDTLSLGASLRKNQTLISKNSTFELGFFSPNGTKKWYLGLWYAQVSDKTVVWVANRDTPIKNAPGVLTLSTDGTLELFDAEGEPVWSINDTAKASVATISNTGNFVMFGAENKSEIVWQSFEHPVDTWLPGMKIGKGQPLISWKNSMDPAPGAFKLLMDPTGAERFVLQWNGRNGSVPYWESGIWEGKNFSNIPELAQNSIFDIRMENSSSSVYFSYANKRGVNFLSRFVLESTGEIGLYSLIEGNRWSLFWMQPRDQCSVYNLCGDYGTCNSNNLQFCSCLPGFEPQDSQAWAAQEWWSSGCVRQTPLSCNAENGSSDGFMQFTSISSPENQLYSYPSLTQQQCEDVCLRNCSCTGYKYAPAGCQIWTESLLNMRNSPPNSPSRNDSAFFIRMAASELRRSSSSSTKTKIIGAVLGTIAAFVAVIVIFGLLLLRRRRRLRSTQRCVDSSNPLLKRFTYKELKIATKNFQDRLGGGEFFSVYKGVLADKTPVAVKRIKTCMNAEKHFQTEMTTVGMLKHENLIGIQGFCSEKSESLLVFDYMPNGSLDSFLFDESKSKYKVLDWKTRFGIALGTAKGVAFLHQKGIVHCDIKPENILLDADFCPKVTGFGLAKVAGRNFRPDLTSIRGTRGYLAPEWMSGLPITAKADVYSFGMTLLELIAGRRNADLSVESTSMFFPTWAANEMKRGNSLYLGEDEHVSWTGNAEVDEIRRATVVGGWCVQESEEARPSMWQVIKTLEGTMDPHTPQALRLLLDRGGKDLH
uniref:Receptor-like serine/threonine-protein kinase n=1 Tax=Wollemia nobilis TaxID=56998 RepID=A0A0C9QPG3_9CONI